jgi:UDP-N-acetylglucosamine/UDP-N-acetylgalactosamine diphosphorylase
MDKPMTSETGIEKRYESAVRVLESRGQRHVLHWWDQLDAKERGSLLADLESISWDTVDPLIASHVHAKPVLSVPKNLLPPDAFCQLPQPGQESLYEKAQQRGRELIGGGKVAAFTVAGGQGTRLGYDGPKGAVVVTPVGGRTLFQIFGDTVKAASDKYGVSIPWYVMTSPVNHDQTVEYFSDHGFFGLPESDVQLFQQGMLPVFDFEGHLLMESKSRLAFAPDGHGGSLKALSASGALTDMKKRGIKIISYFQVDNPLVKPFDPLFIGLHAETGSEMSTKVAAKADDVEKVGNVCIGDGKLTVIEYTDFPVELARQKNADGTRKFDCGDLAMHLLNVAFVDRITDKTLRIPFRRAEKRAPTIDEDGEKVTPENPNAVKLEMLVFDVLDQALNPLVLVVDRTEEFSPVKNASGVDSLQTAQRDQTLKACRWLAEAGVSIPRRADDQPDVKLAIAPSFALDAQDLASRKADLPELVRGASIYIE